MKNKKIVVKLGKKTKILDKKGLNLNEKSNQKLNEKQLSLDYLPDTAVAVAAAVVVVEVEVAGAAAGVVPNENDCGEGSWTLTELRK